MLVRFNYSIFYLNISINKFFLFKNKVYRKNGGIMCFYKIKYFLYTIFFLQVFFLRKVLDDFLLEEQRESDYDVILSNLYYEDTRLFLVFKFFNY